MIRVLGHIGAWAGLYAVAALVCLSQLTGTASLAGYLPRWEAIAVVFLTATGVYALDRVKLRDSWMDPADAQAQPERYEFLRQFSRPVRALAACTLIAAAGVGLRLSPWAPWVEILAASSVIAYAARPRRERSRIKDVHWIKNTYVAAGMTGFVMAASFASHPVTTWAGAESLLIAGAILAVRIGFDAAMCDIDDEPSDRQFGTETWATRLGGATLWNWTGVVRVALIAAIVAAPLIWHAQLAWAAAMLLGMAALRIPRWSRLGEVVDLRFIPEAVIATACIAALDHLS